MDAIRSIVHAVLAALDAIHSTVYGAATSALAGAAGDLWAAPSALALAFAFGMVHALMPGHGKTVIFSYFLGSGARLTTGVAMAVKIAALHVGTAVILLLAIGAAVVRLGRIQGPGRVLVAVMAAGIAVTMSLTGMTAIVARKVLTAGFTPDSPWFRLGTWALELAGAAAILAIGIGSLARIV